MKLIAPFSLFRRHYFVNKKTDKEVIFLIDTDINVHQESEFKTTVDDNYLFFVYKQMKIE